MKKNTLHRIGQITVGSVSTVALAVGLMGLPAAQADETHLTSNLVSAVAAQAATVASVQVLQADGTPVPGNPQTIEMEYRTQPDRPDMAKVTLSDGTTETDQIQWHPLSEEALDTISNQKGGYFTMTGELANHKNADGSFVTVTLRVHVLPASADEITEPSATLVDYQGEALPSDSDNLQYIEVENSEDPSQKLPDTASVSIPRKGTFTDYVTWDHTTINDDIVNSFDGGTFVVKGETQQYGVAVELKVKVKAASIVALSPSSYRYTLTVEAGENEQLKNAPQTVSALYTNGEKRDVPVTWDFEGSNFDINTPGVYTVRGTVEGTSQKPTLTVTVKEAEVKPDHVKPFDDITVANDSGRPNTPDTATLVFTNGDESEVPVIWQPLSEEALDTLQNKDGGTFTMTGETQSDPSFPVSLTVHVLKAEVERIKAEKVTVHVGDKLEGKVPTSVEATLSNSETVSLPVSWDLSTVNVNKEGTYEAKGNVEGYKQNVPAKLTVVVLPRKVVEAHATDFDGNIVDSMTVENGETPDRPSWALVTLNGIDEPQVDEVIWNPLTEADIDVISNPQGGTFDMTGVTQKYGAQVTVHVTVLPAKIVNIIYEGEKTIHVQKGDMADLQSKLPTKVRAVYQGIKDKLPEVPISFDLSTVDINTPGLYDAVGTVEGYDGMLTLHVVVDEAEEPEPKPQPGENDNKPVQPGKDEEKPSKPAEQKEEKKAEAKKEASKPAVLASTGAGITAVAVLAALALSVGAALTFSRKRAE